MDIFTQYEMLQNKNEQELMDTLSELTKEQRKTGEMNNLRMEEIYELLAPMLSEKQRRKMQQVIERLKE